MRLIKHLTTWLLLLTVITASGVVSAKVASGVQNLSGGLHQENATANVLMHLAKIGISYDAASGFPLVPKSGPKLLETPRDVLLRNAQDPRLKDAINNLYRPGAKVGSGSTADAVRFERATGELLSPKGHTQKLLDRRTQLMKLRKDPNLNSGDRRIIHDILKDTQDALSN